jgi:hypothetical protein
MQAAENRHADHAMAVANPMATREGREVSERAVRNAWSQARVRPRSVVVQDPLPEDASQVTLVQRD